MAGCGNPRGVGYFRRKTQLHMHTIGIMGAGAMGSGIAQVAAQNGHPVILCDVHQEALEKSQTKLAKLMARLVEKGRVTAEDAEATQSRIIYTHSPADFKPCDLVIEAIVERLDVKCTVFEKLESIVGPECILATNTSSLSVASIGAACQDASRVVGIHFFNPAPLMPLVEIFCRANLPAVVEAARRLIWKKVVLAKGIKDHRQPRGPSILRRSPAHV